LRTDAGAICLPDVLALPCRRHLPGDQRAAHEIWRQRASAEWASVAAFDELAEQLAACEAPASLRERAWAAAEDEMKHTLIAGGIAAAYADTPIVVEPPAGERRPAAMGAAGWQRLLVESWLDGCVNEGIAAACAEAEAKQAKMPGVAAGLAEIARDEARHAGLAWDVITWMLREQGQTARAILIDALDTTPSAAQPDAHDHADLAGFGCLGAVETAAIGANVLRSARLRMADLLVAG
jgi:hypothetical protein